MNKVQAKKMTKVKIPLPFGKTRSTNGSNKDAKLKKYVDQIN